MRKQFHIYFFMAGFIGLILRPVSAAELVDAAKAFDGYRAHRHIVRQCQFGPRIAGQPGHRLCRDYIVDQLKTTGWKIEIQTFEAYLQLIGKNVTCENIIARLDTPATQTIVMSCHWDTRPLADLDPNPANRKQPIPGANDAGSGVAVLLELAKVFEKHPPPYDMIFLFFDAEDAGLPKSKRQWCLGSSYMASNPPPDFNFIVGVNIDMVADGNQMFYIEKNSIRTASPWVREIWTIGENLYPDHFSFERKRTIMDDHVPFIEKGYRYLDIIDLDYKEWHTLEDRPEKCVPKSLTRIGRTLAQWLFTRTEK